MKVRKYLFGGVHYLLNGRGEIMTYVLVGMSFWFSCNLEFRIPLEIDLRSIFMLIFTSKPFY